MTSDDMTAYSVSFIVKSRFRAGIAVLCTEEYERVIKNLPNYLIDSSQCKMYTEHENQ